MPLARVCYDVLMLIVTSNIEILFPHKIFEETIVIYLLSNKVRADACHRFLCTIYVYGT